MDPRTHFLDTSQIPFEITNASACSTGSIGRKIQTKLNGFYEFFEYFTHVLSRENGDRFSTAKWILRFRHRHRRIIMVRRLTIGRCACLVKRKAKKSAKKKAKRSVKKKQVKPKKKTVEPAPKVTMPESPPAMPTESVAPPVEPTPSQTPPSESGTGTSS